MNTSQVSEINEFESDLIDLNIIYIETVRATNTNFVNCGAGTSRGHGQTAINSAYYFSNEQLKTVKNEPVEGCVNNIQ